MFRCNGSFSRCADSSRRCFIGCRFGGTGFPGFPGYVRLFFRRHGCGHFLGLPDTYQQPVPHRSSLILGKIVRIHVQDQPQVIRMGKIPHLFDNVRIHVQPLFLLVVAANSVEVQHDPRGRGQCKALENLDRSIGHHINIHPVLFCLSINRLYRCRQGCRFFRLLLNHGRGRRLTLFSGLSRDFLFGHAGGFGFLLDDFRKNNVQIIITGTLQLKVRVRLQ